MFSSKKASENPLDSMGDQFNELDAAPQSNINALDVLEISASVGADYALEAAGDMLDKSSKTIAKGILKTPAHAAKFASHLANTQNEGNQNPFVSATIDMAVDKIGTKIVEGLVGNAAGPLLTASKVAQFVDDRLPAPELTPEIIERMVHPKNYGEMFLNEQLDAEMDAKAIFQVGRVLADVYDTATEKTSQAIKSQMSQQPLPASSSPIDATKSMTIKPSPSSSVGNIVEKIGVPAAATITKTVVLPATVFTGAFLGSCEVVNRATCRTKPKTKLSEEKIDEKISQREHSAGFSFDQQTKQNLIELEKRENDSKHEAHAGGQQDRRNQRRRRFDVAGIGPFFGAPKYRTERDKGRQRVEQAEQEIRKIKQERSDLIQKASRKSS